eukprot:jgi/Chrzof1/6056/Cz17g07040.t1
MVALQLRESIGVLFEDYRGSKSWCANFKVIELLYTMLSAVAVGTMTGLAATPGSSTCQALMWTTFGIQVAYASILGVLRPQIDRVQGHVDLFSVWLETGTMMCSCLLQTQQDNESLQNVMFAFSGAALLLQLGTVWTLLAAQVYAVIQLRRHRRQTHSLSKAQASDGKRSLLPGSCCNWKSL